MSNQVSTKWSSVATKHTRIWSKPNRRRIKVGGIVVHTCGKTWVINQLKKGVHPDGLGSALSNYYVKTTGSHCVTPWDGKIIQVASENEVAYGVGMGDQMKVESSQRAWQQSKPGKLWLRRWPGYQQPSDLVNYHRMGVNDANKVFVHIEMIPMLEPDSNGLWFTAAQHQSIADYAIDIYTRHGWGNIQDPDCDLPWWRTPRLVGHEDLSSTRWTSSCGWDPGGMSVVPRFDWDVVYSHISQHRG